MIGTVSLFALLSIALAPLNSFAQNPPNWGPGVQITGPVANSAKVSGTNCMIGWMFPAGSHDLKSEKAEIIGTDVSGDSVNMEVDSLGFLQSDHIHHVGRTLRFDSTRFKHMEVNSMRNESRDEL